LQEEHTLRLIIDPNNQIAETNENDNTQEVRYILQPGRC
jgi:subtilase family serine protease